MDDKNTFDQRQNPRIAGVSGQNRHRYRRKILADLSFRSPIRIPAPHSAKSHSQDHTFLANTRCVPAYPDASFREHSGAIAPSLETGTASRQGLGSTAARCRIVQIRQVHSLSSFQPHCTRQIPLKTPATLYFTASLPPKWHPRTTTLQINIRKQLLLQDLKDLLPSRWVAIQVLQTF